MPAGIDQPPFWQSARRRGSTEKVAALCRATCHLDSAIACGPLQSRVRARRNRPLPCEGTGDASGKGDRPAPGRVVRPKRTAAIASPPRAPGYQASKTAAVRCNHGINTGPPVSSTTIVLGLARTTATLSPSNYPRTSSSGGRRRRREFSPSSAVATFGSTCPLARRSPTCSGTDQTETHDHHGPG